MEEIIIRKGLKTDKWKGYGRGHTYIDFYDRFFRKFRNNKIVILEIGVYHGESLRLWEEYFPNATIYGIDIVKARCYNSDRVKTFYGDSTDKQFVESTFKDMEFDMIIDDGSHRMNYQINTFNLFYKYIKEGGYYIIEDIQNVDFELPEFKKLGECTVVDRRAFKRIEDDVLLVYRK
jgi:cephalosporin hydroxylase